MIGPLNKKVETMEVPQNMRFYGKMECLPFRPTYISDRVVKTDMTWPFCIGRHVGVIVTHEWCLLRLMHKKFSLHPCYLHYCHTISDQIFNFLNQAIELFWLSTFINHN